MGDLPQHDNTSKGLHKSLRAEILHDYNMNLSAVALMLPYFAATGKGQYAKALRLYL